MNSEDRNVVLQFIHDVISWLKARLKGEKVSLKIVKLENRFAAVLRNVDNTNAQKNNTTNDGDVQYLFAGQKSRTSNYSLLDQAIKLEDVGKATSEEIRQQTGWFRGYDGKWRYDISDRDIEVDTTGKFHTNPDIRRQTELFNKVYFDATATENEIKELQILNKNLKGVIAAPQKLGQLIKHTKLFDAYPWLKDVNIRFEFISERGAYNPVFNEIVLSNHIKLNKEQLTKTLIHEIQHAIQYYEAFASGSNTEYWRDLGIDENELFKYYENTAGEIEARDAASRWWRSDEARKEKRPDIDRSDVVFVDKNMVYYSASENKNSSIKQQLREHSDEINAMQPVAHIQYVPTSKQNLRLQAVQEFKKIGYAVDRQNFGVIEINEGYINQGLNYINTESEKAALLAVPKVLKRGIDISTHDDHKGRSYGTVTIAAPVSINGKVGNVAVVVKMTGKNRYSTHRILMPDGSEFIFEKNKNTELTSSDMLARKSDQGTDISSVLDSTVPQEAQSVNTHYMQESENYSSQEQNDGGILYSFGDIDKEGKKRDNISRANKTGELINEFYYALDKSEWNLFYRKIAESGFLEKTDVGDVVAVSIGGKLIIAERQMTGTDAHDFQIVAAYQEENGDWYVTNEIADIINESEDVYDKSRIESTIIRLGKKIDETSIFNRYDREHGEFVNNTYKRANGSRSTTTDGGHRTRTYGEGISSPVKQNTQRINAGLDDSAFSMPENDDVKYSFEDDVVDKTSSLAERVRLGEISQTEYLNELQSLMYEANEKYGAIPKGENPVVSNLS